MRTAEVRLYRALPPFVNRVTVGPITVRAFGEILKTMGEALFSFGVKHGREQFTEADVWAALAPVQVSATIADLVCIGQPRGFFKAWSNNRNLKALMRGVIEVETLDGLAEMWNLVDWTGERVKREGGGFGSDIEAVSKIDGVSVVTIWDWTMRDFLARCDMLKAATRAGYMYAHADDPTLDPNAEPTPLPGRGVTH